MLKIIKYDIEQGSVLKNRLSYEGASFKTCLFKQYSMWCRTDLRKLPLRTRERMVNIERQLKRIDAGRLNPRDKHIRVDFWNPGFYTQDSFSGNPGEYICKQFPGFLEKLCEKSDWLYKVRKKEYGKVNKSFLFNKVGETGDRKIGKVIGPFLTSCEDLLRNYNTLKNCELRKKAFIAKKALELSSKNIRQLSIGNKWLDENHYDAIKENYHKFVYGEGYEDLKSSRDVDFVNGDIESLMFLALFMSTQEVWVGKGPIGMIGFFMGLYGKGGSVGKSEDNFKVENAAKRAYEVVNKKLLVYDDLSQMKFI